MMEDIHPLLSNNVNLWNGFNGYSMNFIRLHLKSAQLAPGTIPI